MAKGLNRVWRISAQTKKDYNFGMIDSSPLARIDSYPYRHRIAEVMSSPVVTAVPGLTVIEACERMADSRLSALVVVDDVGKAIGIVTERDLLRLFAREHDNAFRLPLDHFMSRPVKTVPAEAYLFVALGRMARLNLRHLVACDEHGRPVGMVTGRALLKVRAGDSLLIADSVHEAENAVDLARARAGLPGLVAAMLAETVPARDIASVISAVMRDMTARAGYLAESDMARDGWGPPPCPWALLVLGSGGRGESLLAFDQDNAIVYDGSVSADPWFAEMGRRIADMLNAAGIPYCKGGIMAREKEWRRSLDGWQAELRRWVFDPDHETVLASDIFFDFQPVAGDVALAAKLRAMALDIVGKSNFFLQFLALEASRLPSPFGLFGQLSTKNGRIDAKMHGLLPLVSTARAKALAENIAATGTIDRLRALAEKGKFHRDDLTALVEGMEVLQQTILAQQIADLEAGLPATAAIDPRRLSRPEKRRLRQAFERVRMVKNMASKLGGVA